jgi:hypothetical protein
VKNSFLAKGWKMFELFNQAAATRRLTTQLFNQAAATRRLTTQLFNQAAATRRLTTSVVHMRRPSKMAP